ncbi:MAG: ZIP family zinc transporter [bacterium]|nr:ZIP family zinc transporter [bacterium]
MVQAIIFGAVSGLSLLFGAATGLIFKLNQKVIARFMAFGAGVLVCALTFGLMEEAFGHGGFDAIIIGFLLGGIVFILGDYVLHLKGGRRHKRHQLVEARKDSNGKVITMGALLDGIPESVALGIALFTGGGTGILMLVAIVLSNFPEGISSVDGLKKEGFTSAGIYKIWGVVALLALIFTVLSFVFLHDITPNTIGIIEAFAAGAILAMLADSMMPEAFDDGGFSIGILTVLGFLTAFIVSKLS